MMTSSSESYFKTIPWCASLLGQRDVHTFTPICRLAALDGDNTNRERNRLFRHTLTTDDTIPECIGFYNDPFLTHIVPQPAASRILVDKAFLLFDLRPGVNGYNGTAHGGLITSLIDEAMGSLIQINHLVEEQEIATGRRTLPQGVHSLNAAPIVTAELNVRFLKPLATPQVIMVIATSNRIEGRTLFLDAEVRGDKDMVFAQGRGRWIFLTQSRV
jgi:acyl-coenzyme A thioesterase PaaI-like protein